MPEAILKGRVYDAVTQRGLQGILVSTGDSIVLSDANGGYALPVDVGLDRCVFISTPAGYRPQERFYAHLSEEPLPESVDFPLIPGPERARDEFRVAHISDTHVVVDDSGAVTQAELAQDLADLAATASPDFVVVTGDLTNMGTQPELESYQAAVASAPAPVFSVFGGHDGNVERRSSNADTPCTRNFEATLGPTYYSFDWGAYHFIVCATEEAYYSTRERSRKERWLWADLELRPAGRPAVLMMHTAPDAALLSAFRQRGGVLLLHGHWHSSRVFTEGSAVVASAPSACFGGIDTRPRGYRLVEFSPRGASTALHPLSAAPQATSSTAAAGHAGPQAAPTALQTGTSALGGSDRRCGPLGPDSAVPREVVGDQMYGLSWKRKLAGPLHRAPPISHRDALLVSLHSESYPGEDGVVSLDLASGRERWRYGTGAAVKNNVAIVPRSDSTSSVEQAGCAALTVTGELNLIDAASGAGVWRAALPGHPHRWVYSAPAAAGDLVFAGSKAGYGAYDVETGQQAWYAALESGDEWPSYIRPQIYKEDLAIVLVQRRGILALRMADGSIAWEQDVPVEYFCGSPALAGELLVVSSAAPLRGASLTGGKQGDLAVLEAATGQMVAHHRHALPGYATGLAVRDNRIYAATAAGTVHCRDLRTCAQIWQYQSGPDLLDLTPYRRGIMSLLAAPTPVGEHVLVGGCDGWLHVLDGATGACTDRIFLGAPITAPPTRTPRGFCVATYDGTLYAYGVSS